MVALFRLLVLVFLLEIAFFLLIRLYLRSLRRERFEDEWDSRHPERAGNSPQRQEFVRRAMVGFDKTLRARLLWLVFIIPTAAVMGIIYWVNWQ